MQKIGFCDKYSLTQAVLNGTKTMTRRVEKGLETFEFDYEVHFVHSMEIINQYWDEEKNSLVIITPQGKMKVPTRYKLGEVVAVAQSYKDVINTGYDLIEKRNLREKLENELGLIMLEYAKGWNNKLFVKPDLMPHQIQMTDVSIERLKAISDDDCFKEGVLTNQFGDYWFKGFPPQKVVASMTPREAFALLIDRPGVGRKGLWESNPFSVVYEFQLVK